MPINVVQGYKFDPTGVQDNAAMFASLVTDLQGFVSNKKPMPKVIFPEGVYKYSSCPNLGLPNLDFEGQGYVELVYTGNGTALTFAGPPHAGTFNLRFDGFHIVTNDNAGDSLLLAGIHHSHFRVHIHGAGIPKAGTQTACLRTQWCVCTHFEDLTISPADIYQGLTTGVTLPGGRFNQGIVGVWLDMLDGTQTNDCTFERPVLETLPTAVFINNAGDCSFDNGTFESGGKGVVINNGGHNVFRQIDMESNSDKDVTFLGGAHDNLVLMCGDNGKLNVAQGGSRNLIVHHLDFSGFLFGN